MISFSSLSKRRGATLAGVFSVGLSCVLLLCGAGSVPVENLLPQGAMQGDLNAGGHSLTNAATVSATTVTATSVQVTGLISQASVGTDSNGNLVAGGAALALGTVNGGALTLYGNVLDFASPPNQGGGVALLTNSSGGADGSIAFMSMTDTDNYSVAMGFGANANGGAVAVGYESYSMQASSAVGQYTSAYAGGGAIGNYAATQAGGFAGGMLASAMAGGGAVGNGAFTSTGFAGGICLADGSPTYAPSGGANFCGGIYNGTGIAINGDEIAVFNGSGFATLTACMSASAPGATAWPGVAGQIAYDSNYFYVCVAANSWKRAALSTW